MKMQRIDVTIKVEREGFQSNTAMVTLFVPEGSTNSREISDALTAATKREVETLIVNNTSKK